jgi:signal transduction histidine kinase
MHFIAFIGSAILITYQNWKLQIPLTLVVLIHHAIFGYLQFTGADVYFTELEYMDLQTFIIHAILAAILFFTCGIWAYQFKKYSRRHIELAYNEARLTESELQKDALMKANNELDKFVYSVSHDLRAPLSSMKGVIEISEDITEDELLLEHFSRLKGSINKLDEFIKDILEYSRNSRLKVKHQQIDFKSMLADITDNLRFMSSNNDNQVDITTLIKGDSVFYSDKSRISIILNNLISNAIRYQNPDIKNPFVKVSIEISDAEATIIVEDNGIGISEEHQTKVFEMFYRVSENSVGSGLGLYLVKEIIDKLGGKIKITSGINKGTSFCISIPGNQAEYSDENDTLLNVA